MTSIRNSRNKTDFLLTRGFSPLRIYPLPPLPFSEPIFCVCFQEYVVVVVGVGGSRGIGHFCTLFGAHKAIHLMKIILQKVHTLSGFSQPPLSLREWG